MDTPFWLDEPSIPVDSGPEGAVDVAIIGAGITGVSCALALARGGLRVRVHDARGVAEGTSGVTTALLRENDSLLELFSPRLLVSG